MEKLRPCCDWRGMARCSHPAEVELVGSPSAGRPARRRLVCRAHSSVIIDYCSTAGLDSPTAHALRGGVASGWPWPFGLEIAPTLRGRPA